MYKISYDHIEPYIPNMTQLKATLISSEWEAFWKNPTQFKDTDLPKTITKWVEVEVTNYYYDELGQLKKKGK